MSRAEHGRVGAGIVLFITLSFLGSWLVATTLRFAGAAVAPEPLGPRLFTTSLLYRLTMGWPPIVATWFVRRWVDLPCHLDLACGPLGVDSASSVARASRREPATASSQPLIYVRVVLE